MKSDWVVLLGLFITKVWAIEPRNIKAKQERTSANLDEHMYHAHTITCMHPSSVSSWYLKIF